MIDSIKNKFKDKKFIIFSLLCLILLICPFLNVLKSGSNKLNYIYNDGKLADGIFVIILVITIFILNIFNLKKISLIPLVMLSALLIMLFINLANDNLLRYVTFNFYLMYICLIGIVLLSIVFIFKK